MTVILSEILLLDLFFRFAGVGQLILLVTFLWKRSGPSALAAMTLAVCVGAYVLLTAPIDDKHYGMLRNILLLLTDLTPFGALWFTLRVLNRDVMLHDVPRWLLVPAGLWLLVLVYLFLVLDGRGVLHDANHVLGMMTLGWVIYLCLAEFVDDLDNPRRNTRLLIVSVCALYMIGLVLFEFVYRDVRNTWQFSLTNAVVMCTAIVVLGFNVLKRAMTVQSLTDPPEQKASFEPVVSEQPELHKLTATMQDAVFLQPELTIGKLADMLDMPAHQLRALINQQLGFSNFSHFLNSYRIPWVCEQLQQQPKKIPILTIALEAGYGSIATFNRAFKGQMGQTAREYRDQF